MTPEQFAGLERGDIIRHKGNADGWLVSGRWGDALVLLRHTMATNPEEWDLATKSVHFTIES